MIRPMRVWEKDTRAGPESIKEVGYPRRVEAKDLARSTAAKLFHWIEVQLSSKWKERKETKNEK